MDLYTRRHIAGNLRNYPGRLYGPVIVSPSVPDASRPPGNRFSVETANAAGEQA